MTLNLNHFGVATGKIRFDDVDCRAKETSLAYCEHTVWSDYFKITITIITRKDSIQHKPTNCLHKNIKR